MTRCSELAHQKHVHRNAQCGSDFVGDWNSTARQRQNNDVVAARVFRQTRRQHATCVTAIDECLVLIHGGLPVSGSHSASTSRAPAAVPVATFPALRRDASHAAPRPTPPLRAYFASPPDSAR